MSEVLLSVLADPFGLAGLIAGAISIFAYLPYILDTWRGHTQPDRACWMIWAVLASISGASNLYEGAGASMVFIGVQVLGTLVVFGLSIWRGAGSYLSATNVLILGAAAIGLYTWYFTHDAVYALAISIAVSALGGLNTVLKAYRDPESETLSTWVMSVVAAGLGVASVGVLDPVLLAYPVYLLMLYAAIVIAVLWGRVVQGRAAARSIVWSSRLAAAHRARAQAARIKMPPPAIAPAYLTVAA